MVMQRLRPCQNSGTTAHSLRPLPSARDHGDGLSAAAIAGLAVDWHAGDEASAAAQITRATLIAVPGADAVGILRVAGGHRLAGQAPTDDTAAELDELQAELGDGPSPVTLRTGRPVVVNALSAQPHWPAFTSRAAECGIAAIACLPLGLTGHNLGTLNLYAGAPGAFVTSTGLAAVLAIHAALALHAIAEREQLRRAVASRDRIGQAKGILMVRHHCTAKQAFDQLVAESQAVNLKLVDVADRTIAEQRRRSDARVRLVECG